MHNRQEMLMTNLIRKILLKDFTCCDCNIEMCSSNFNENDNDVHHRNCIPEAFPQLPKNCILKSILKAQHLVRENFDTMEYLEKNCDVQLKEGYEQIIQDYRMGSTALDCSVMVTFRRINEENFDVRDNLIDRNHYVTFNGPNGFMTQQQQHFTVNATIVDLDEKKDSFAHFSKYKKQYRDSIVAYEDFMKANKFIKP